MQKLNENYLIFSLSDVANDQINQDPQVLDNFYGKINYIHLKKLNSGIYSIGHRNPQGLIFHPERKELWNTEHGPRGGDELNVVRKGANYGWPVITYGINYSGTPITDKTEEVGMEQPIYYWVPSIAPSSLCYIDSPMYADWKGDILVG